MSIVYIIAPEDAEQPIKVGVSDDPDERLYALQIGSPSRLRLVEIFGCDTRREAMQLERRFHRAHALFHLHGEWFSIGAQEANYWLYCETVQ